MGTLKKLIDGIVQFKNETSESQLEIFQKLALGQTPDALFIGCSDSRVVPNLLVSTNPGDLFVMRNVGNIIPPAKQNGCSSGDVSEIAAIEFSMHSLNIKDIIICGHSECGAMSCLLEDDFPPSHYHISQWLKHAKASKDTFDHLKKKSPSDLSDINALSQINVLQQINHLKTYPLIRDRINQDQLKFHAWWFDIASATVYIYNYDCEKFEALN